MRRSVLAALPLLAAFAACGEPANAPRVSAANSLMSKSAAPRDPSATWSIPLADAGLALKSDGKFGDGTSSVYANGVCGVGTNIFATTASGPNPTGDATLQMSYPKGHGCGRTVIMSYPDGGADTLATFSNLNKLESNDPITAIPIGQTSLRRLIVGFSDRILGNPTPGRCGAVIFGDNGHLGAGTDMLLVTRVDASTWHVQSQAAPNNRALCANLGAIYDNMTIDLTIVSSYPLP